MNSPERIRSTTMSLADAAAVYAASGLPPIIIKPNGKIPLEKNWTDGQKLTPSEAYAKFDGLDCNIGIAIPMGLVVIDCDTKTPGGGLEALEEYAATRGTLTGTWTAKTQSGGRHLVYKLPAGLSCNNGVNKLPGVDIRTHGGQIVVEPSQIDGRKYEWLDYELSAGEVPQPALLPEWLYPLLGVHAEGQQAPVQPQAHNGDGIPEGKRNDTLFRMGCGLRRRGADYDTILAALTAINATACHPPLLPDEVSQITASVMHYPPEADHTPPPPDWITAAPPMSVYELDPPSLAEIDSYNPLSTYFEATLICAAEIPTEPVVWLWSGYVPAGKLALIAGAPGCGKTTAAIAIAATVSAGGIFPDGVRCTNFGNVLIWSGEDDPGDTLKPRLMAAGADLSRCHFITGIRTGAECVPFDPARHMHALDVAATQLGDVRLLIVDPIVSAVEGDSHKNAEVRRGLQAIVHFAQQHRCAVLGITHFTKGTSGRDPVERITGSLAFAALARVVLVAAKERSGEDERRVFVRAKSNIGPDGGGFEYTLNVVEVERGVYVSCVDWGDVIEGEAREILSEVEAPETEEKSAVEVAVKFLREVLAHGSVPSRELMKMAKANSISKRTLGRARKEIGAMAKRREFGGGTIWYLPAPVVPTKAIHAEQFCSAQMKFDGTNGEARADSHLSEGDS
ncbi:AAA family ATPase [Uliginosibacterium sp. H3]|uniref:AAA family ATPase n=1 Tax=Uliginosibacterium silvisoli TaxID=3114758 RepID=A0ABU6K6C0_9RHOO|nr:AAA family ATPase [Uliginosibacterium sp. H3]